MTLSRLHLEMAGIVAAVLVIMGCTVTLLRRTPGQQTVASVLRSATQPEAGQLEAFIVFQREDCSSSLEFASLITRPSVQGRVRFRGFLLIGTEPDLRVARQRLAAPGFHHPLRRVDRAAAAALAALGHRATPFLVVLDEWGSVRLSMAAPATPEEFVYLASLLARIALRQ